MEKIILAKCFLHVFLILSVIECSFCQSESSSSNYASSSYEESLSLGSDSLSSVSGSSIASESSDSFSEASESSDSFSEARESSDSYSEESSSGESGGSMMSASSSASEVNAAAESSSVSSNSMLSTSSATASTESSSVVCETSTYTKDASYSCDTYTQSSHVTSCGLATATNCETSVEESYSTECELVTNSVVMSSCPTTSCEVFSSSSDGTSCVETASCEMFTESDVSTECQTRTDSSLATNCYSQDSLCDTVTESVLETVCNTVDASSSELFDYTVVCRTQTETPSSMSSTTTLMSMSSTTTQMSHSSSTRTSDSSTSSMPGVKYSSESSYESSMSSMPGVGLEVSSESSYESSMSSMPDVKSSSESGYVSASYQQNYTERTTAWATVTSPGTSEPTVEKSAALEDPKLYPFGTSRGDINIRDPEILNSRWGYENGYECYKVQILKEGFPFYDKRHFHLYICDNGLIQFDTRWKLFYPFDFSPRGNRYHWLNRYSLVAAYWGVSDANLMLLSGKESKHTNVTYQIYDKFDTEKDSSRVLNRISADIRNMTRETNLTSFEATWSMVVTWVNLAPWVSYYCKPWYIQYIQRYYVNSSSSNSDFWQKRIEECYSRAQSAKLNHFQLVLATDGSYSFAKIIFPNGGINWAHPDISYTQYKKYTQYYKDTGYLPTSGYSTPKHDTDRYFYSRSVNTDSYSLEKVSGGWRMESVDDIEGNTGHIGEWFLRLENFTGEQENLAKCVSWANSKKSTNKTRSFLYREYQAANPCPCTMWQAWFDRRFMWSPRNWYRFEERYCFESTFQGGPFYDSNNATFYLKQKCCYDTDWNIGRPLLVGPPRGGNLMVSDEPFPWLRWWWWWWWYFRNNEIDDETKGYELCCIASSKECGLFYDLRPPTNCTGYVQPIRRRPLGDPHFLSLDGFNFTFNGLGEFVLLNLNDSQLQVQVRTVKAGEVATMFSSVAIQEKDKVPIQINLVNGTDNELELYINGVLEDIGNYTNETSTHSLLQDTFLSRPTNTSFQIDLTNGVAINVTADGGMITPIVTVPEKFENLTEGLLGVMNRDPSDDLTSSNGTILPLSSSEKEIYYDFGMTWQVTNTSGPKQSIFHYPENKTFLSFINVGFVPMFTDNITFANATLEALAKEACGDNIQCLFDIASTGSLNVGKLTKSQEDEEEDTRSKMENFPPSANGPSKVLLNLNEIYQFKINASDQNGDAITYSVSSNISHLANVTDLGNGEALVSVMVTTLDEFQLIIIVKDAKGATQQLWIEVTLCACQNGGNCQENLGSSQGRFQIMSCDCAEGYTGTYCDSDLDACAENSEACYQGVTCLDKPPPANITGYDCGPCPNGYTGDGKTCSDLNECADASTNPCEQVCLNTPGSFGCVCNAGYSLASNGANCTDDNECVPSSDCSQNCNNTVGSYVCYCDSGFTLEPDGKSCTPSNPCNSSQNVGCDLVNGWCFMEGGQSKCGCKKGYELGNDARSCNDVDECANGQARCTQNCTNLNGTYSCGCKSGYSIGADGYTCEDVDECYEGTDDCLESQKCTNVPGSFNCSCPDGQVLKNGLCIEQSDSEKPAPPSNRVPSQVEKDNSVSFTAKSMTTSEYTVQVDRDVRTKLAEKATEYCNLTSCTSQTVPSSAQSRRKRSTPSYTFTIVHIQRAAGYPQVSTSDSSDIILSYYLVPSTSDGSVVVLAGNDTFNIITSGLPALMAALGNKTIENVQVYIPPTTPTTTLTTSNTSSTSNETQTPVPTAEAGTPDWVYGIIGASVALVVIIIVVIAVVFWKKKTGFGKVSQADDADARGVSRQSNRPQSSRENPNNSNTDNP